MKTNKSKNILLIIIAINLTLITLIQLDLFPQKAYANDINTTNTNYGLVPLNENGSIEIELSPEQLEVLKSSINDDDYIIERILYCIDGSSISDGTFSTYCNR